MADELGFKTELSRAESESELFQSASTKLKEVARDIQDKLGIERISQGLVEKARRLDGVVTGLSLERVALAGLDGFVDRLYDQGRAADAETLTERKPQSSLVFDKFLGKIARLGRYVPEHLNLYAANALVGAVVCCFEIGVSDQEMRNQRILYDALLDEARELFWYTTFTDPGMIGEQAALKGIIHRLRGLNRACEDERLHNIGDEELAGYFKEAANEFEKARVHGKEDEQVLSELASCYAHLAKLAEETPERIYYAQEALNVFHVLMPIEGDGFLSCFNRLEMAKMYIALDKPNKAAATLILGAASAGRANIAWLKEGACDEIREIYTGQPDMVERALELVEERQHR